jgi:AcrR family transcriptional regulator
MTRRSPRPTDEVRRLILNAAAELFAERGYARTTTRDITQLAGVTPYQLFAQFGTKARLFGLATVGPYCELIGDYLARWNAEPALDRPATQLCEDILRGLAEVFAARRGLIAALVIAQAHEAGLAPVLHDGLAMVERALRPLERFTAGQALGRGYRDVDAGLAVRLTHGAILAATLFESSLAATAPRAPATTEAMTEAMTGLMLHGLTRGTGRPAGSTVSRPAEGVPASPERRRPRSPTRDRITASATLLFAERGYPGASTKLIARAAGTSEPVLFSHFGTKSELFDLAVAQRWRAQVDQFVRETRPAGGEPAGVGPLLAEMFRLLHGNRLSVLALLEVELRDAPGGPGRRSRPLADLLDLLDQHLTPRADQGPSGAGASARLVLCTLLGATALDAWVFTGAPPPPSALEPGVVGFLLGGLMHQPSAGVPSRR